MLSIECDQARRQPPHLGRYLLGLRHPCLVKRLLLRFVPAVNRRHAHIRVRPRLNRQASPEVFDEELGDVLALGADWFRKEEQHCRRKCVPGSGGSRSGRRGEDRGWGRSTREMDEGVK